MLLVSCPCSHVRPVQAPPINGCVTNLIRRPRPVTAYSRRSLDSNGSYYGYASSSLHFVNSHSE